MAPAIPASVKVLAKGRTRNQTVTNTVAENRRIVRAHRMFCENRTMLASMAMITSAAPKAVAAAAQMPRRTITRRSR